MSQAEINVSTNQPSPEENKEEITPRNNEEENKDNEENKENEDNEENKENEDNEENKEEKENKNEENKEEPEEPKEPPFSYLERVQSDINLKENDETQPFSAFSGNFKYCICILMEKNDALNSISLKQTLRSIGKNLNKLKVDLNIEEQAIGIFIFINEMEENTNFLKNDNNGNENEENNTDYVVQEWQMNVDNKYLL